jgi:hypothetical protein
MMLPTFDPLPSQDLAPSLVLSGLYLQESLHTGTSLRDQNHKGISYAAPGVNKLFFASDSTQQFDQRKKSGNNTWH